MTFKAMVPIYDKKNNFIGIFETITHFNSISKKLAKGGTKAVIMTDKSYKQQLTKAFTNIFVGNYYVANLDADTKLLEHLRDEGVEKHIDKVTTTKLEINLDIGYISSYYGLYDINGNRMGHFLLFHKLNEVDISSVDDIESTYSIYQLISMLFLAIFFYLFYSIQKNLEAKNIANKTILVLLAIFLVIVFVIYKLLEKRLHTDIDFYKTELTQKTLHEYDLIYNKNKNISNLIFKTYIDTKDIKDLFKTKNRDALISYLDEKYRMFKTEFNVRQLHFHLPNSNSFLRMHRPEKFGDSLKGIRHTVDYVNKYKKAIDGFEEGRIFNGFRYVYPVIDKNDIHLGSVEISFDAYRFIEDYVNDFNKRANFLVKKDVVDEKVFNSEKSNYIKSPVEGFYFDRHVLEKLQMLNKHITPKKKSKEKLLEVSNKILKGEPFIAHFTKANELVIVIPLVNKVSKEVVGSLHLTDNDDFIVKKTSHFYTLMTVLTVVLAFIMIAIYKELISKYKFLEISTKNTKILNSQSSLIIITNGVNMKEANQTVYEFFNYVDFDSFVNDHDCVCDFFEYEKDKEYIQRTMGELNWFEYILYNPLKQNKVKMLNYNGEAHIFRIEFKEYDKNKNLYIVSLIDITEVENINITLSKKIEKALEKNTKQQQLMQQQSKLAAMGEMIGAIAHQWRQPLNELGITIQNLKYDYKDNLIDEEFISEFINKNKKTIKFMSNTIDNFRNFFRIDKEKNDFSIKEAIESTLTMQESQLKSHNIIVTIIGEDFNIHGFQNEFQQVVLNLINNSKDALTSNCIENPKINIILRTNKIEIEDNAGGIPDDVINRVFEPYFTTKDQGKGTGMGLYMSKMIIEDNMNGKLYISNYSLENEDVVYGTKLIIEISKDSIL